MKTAFLCAASLLFVACQQSDIYQNSRQQIDLSGTWSTEIGDVALPGTTDESRVGQPLTDRSETGRLSRRYTCVQPLTYRKTVDIPAEFVGKSLRLIMEKTKPSTLWIDGDSIGSYNHLHTPHIYDVTFLTAGEHKIEIRIDNSDASILPAIGGSHAVTEHTQTNWNGILGEFCIEAANIAHITDIQVYPNIKNAEAEVRIAVVSPVYHECCAQLSINGKSWNTKNPLELPEIIVDTDLQGGADTIKITIPMRDKMQLWSEFEPTLYKLAVEMRSEFGIDRQIVNFGMREFTTEGTKFKINGLTTFLRGKHDACVFPLTGYAPMTCDQWLKVFNIAKSYGINHYRFHSWTPPRAAFEAADIAGIYLQCEMPYWGDIQRDNTELNTFLKSEGDRILAEFGNHASFAMMAHGNELWGDETLMREWTEDFRQRDPRHLYAFGSNNKLGFAGPQEGEDFFVTCRVGGEMPGEYNTHVRSSFSFADAADGGILNGTYPNTRVNYTQAIAPCPIPVVSHETCQFQIYPDYAEIQKYTGVLEPVNLMIFQERLKAANLESEAEAFHYASGALSMICYKADMEICLRTTGFGGFQLLDLQDYPGQGSALCAPLDAFMETKNITTPEEFKFACAPLTVLASFDKYTWTNSEQFVADVLLANYDCSALTNEKLCWTISDVDGQILANGTLEANAKQGEVATIGTINVDLKNMKIPSALKLSLQCRQARNEYNIWVYDAANLTDLEYVTKLDEIVRKRLENGETVLYVPDFASIESKSVGGLFTPDYWNYAMFRSISENLGRPVSPGTLGYAIESSHPLFCNFPTSTHSDWQWWTIAKNSRPFMLDGTPTALRPIVWAIDNVERNHKLAILFELSVSNGRLLVSTTNLSVLGDTPEGRQYVRAIAEYMKSQDFAPSFALNWDELQQLFTAPIEEREIIGVENITDYTGQ